jgi:hypothetical protein
LARISEIVNIGILMIVNLVIDYWLPATGYWQLATDCCLEVICNLFLKCIERIFNLQPSTLNPKP